jgi:hypothetical protein
MNGDSPAKSLRGLGTSPQPELTVRTSGSRVERDCLMPEQIQTGYTNHSLSARSDEDEPPQSVIHAPPGFGDFVWNSFQRTFLIPRLTVNLYKGTNATHARMSRGVAIVVWLRCTNGFNDCTNNEQKSIILKASLCNLLTARSLQGYSPISPPPLTTSVDSTLDCSERATPRAQTRHEFEEIDRHTRSSSLEGIVTESSGLLFN